MKVAIPSTSMASLGIIIITYDHLDKEYNAALVDNILHKASPAAVSVVEQLDQRVTLRQ